MPANTKHAWFNEGRMQHAEGHPRIANPKSWQQLAFNAGWDEAESARDFTSIGRNAAIMNLGLLPIPPKPDTPTEHAHDSHGRMLYERAIDLFMGGQVDRALRLRDKAMRFLGGVPV